MKYVKIYENHEEFLKEFEYLYVNQHSIDFEKLGYDYNVNGVTQEFLDEHNITLEDYEEKYCTKKSDRSRYTIICCFNCWECYECRYCKECVKCECCDNCENCKNCVECHYCNKCENKMYLFMR